MSFQTDPDFGNELGRVRFHQSWAFRFENTNLAQKNQNNNINNNK